MHSGAGSSSKWMPEAEAVLRGSGDSRRAVLFEGTPWRSVHTRRPFSAGSGVGVPAGGGWAERYGGRPCCLLAGPGTQRRAPVSGSAFMILRLLRFSPPTWLSCTQDSTLPPESVPEPPLRKAAGCHPPVPYSASRVFIFLHTFSALATGFLIGTELIPPTRTLA